MCIGTSYCSAKIHVHSATGISRHAVGHRPRQSNALPQTGILWVVDRKSRRRDIRRRRGKLGAPNKRSGRMNLAYTVSLVRTATRSSPGWSSKRERRLGGSRVHHSPLLTGCSATLAKYNFRDLKGSRFLLSLAASTQAMVVI